MAISKEDKKDVKNAMGKALANKVEKVTRDGGRMAYDKAAAEHKAGAPYKTALDAIKSPTFKRMHDARKALRK